MAVSTFEIFKIGIGPSSSHTVGPMHAARQFAELLISQQMDSQCAALQVGLYGSLGHTGRGHGSDKAVLLGLEGWLPDNIDPDDIDGILAAIADRKAVRLASGRQVALDPRKDLLFHKRKTLPYHPNGMRFTALKPSGEVIAEKEYYSVGGGFVVNEDEAAADRIIADTTPVPYPFATGADLLEQCNSHQLSIAQIMFANEQSWAGPEEIRDKLRTIWQAMQDCVTRGCRSEGVLPGGLKVKRRAPELARELRSRPEASLADPLTILDWLNVYALAVNEENAAGGRVVTAPTNGAAGIVPAIGHYYDRFCSSSSEQGIFDYLLTAAAIGMLYINNASISGAEVGCQGEVGVACSMAAGGLTAALGGSPEQVENAAEIGMEHNLGLTCDPIGGLVQIPCIERNAMGAVKALNAQRMAMRGDGQHSVSLDKVIKTMRDTGADMKTKYKETSRGGLAVNVIEC